MDNKYFTELKLVNGILNIEQISPVTFINADNMVFLRWCKENMLYQYWHIAIVDPPYGVNITNQRLGTTNASKEKTYKRGSWDEEVPTAEYWELLKYCCRHLVVWGGNYFSNFIPPGRCFITWDKKKYDLDFADGELALTTLDKNAKIIARGRTAKGEDDGEKRHDTQKPVYLYEATHLHCVERNWRILDTHGGSHTHAIAAYKNNLQLTIIEREESYHLDGISHYKKACIKGRLAF